MKKFLVSTSNVYGYDKDDVLLFVGKTTIDSSIEHTIQNTDIRAGRDNALQFVYYHTGDFNVSITDAQWSLAYLALHTGNTIGTGENVWTEEVVTLTAGSGTVTKTPIAPTSTLIYGWVTFPGTDDTDVGVTERVAFTGSTFAVTNTSYAGTVCIRYFARDNAAKSLNVPTSALPKVFKLVLENKLCSASGTTTTEIGKVQVIVPNAQANGAFTISTTADGVSNTPLAVRALETIDATATGCAGNRIYAKIIEIITSANWYDDVVALAVVGGDFILPNLQTKTLDIRAIPRLGAAFKPDYSALTFTPTTVACSAAGVVTGAAGGGKVIVTITAKPDIEVTVIVAAS